MEPERSLLCSQKHVAGPYLQLEDSSPDTDFSWRYILSSHLFIRLTISLFPSGFPTKVLYAFLIQMF
jgi:hypothetical protein